MLRKMSIFFFYEGVLQPETDLRGSTSIQRGEIFLEVPVHQSGQGPMLQVGLLQNNVFN